MRRLLAAAMLAAGQAAAQDVGDALQVGDLICEFGRDGRSLIAELADAPRTSDLLLVYGGIL